MSRTGIVTLLSIVLLVGVVLLPISQEISAQDPSILTYTSRDGTFSFDYPAGWELQENNNGTLTLTGVDALSPSGNPIQIDIFQPVSAVDPATNIKATPSEAVEAFQVSEFGNSLEFTDITRTSVGDKPAAFTTAPGSLNNSTLDFFYIAVDMGGDDIATILAQTVAGELPIYQASILAISGSFRINVQTLTATPTPQEVSATETPTASTVQPFISADGTLSFDYPIGWTVAEGEDGFELTATDLASASGVASQFNLARPEILTQDDLVTRVTLREAIDLLQQAVIEELQSSNNVTLEPTEIMSITLGGKSAEYVTILSEPDSGQADLMLMVVEFADGSMMAVTAVMPPGEYALYEAPLFEIVASVQYTPAIVGTPEPALVTVNVSRIEGLTGTYLSLDGLFSFSYVEAWVPNEGASLILQILDPTTASQVAYVEVVPPQSAFVLDYSGAGTATGVLESFKSNMMRNYAFSDTLQTDIGGKRVAFVTSSVSYDNNTVTRDFMFAVVDVGGNNVVLVYLEAPVGQLNAYQPDVFALIQTINSSVPASQRPPTVPQVTPPPSTDGATSVPVQPPPVVNQPARGDGRVVLFYSNGTMTIYNSSDTPVSIEGLELVTPDGNRRFIARDYGFYFQRVFAPDRCVHIHLNTQPFSAPSFCRRTGTRQLTYLFGDRQHLYFVWHPAFNPSGTFLVQRMGETLATCSIAAGECEFQAPITYIPYE